MMVAGFILTLAAFATACGYTMIAVAKGADSHMMIGLACMIITAIMAGNAAGAIAGGPCG